MCAFILTCGINAHAVETLPPSASPDTTHTSHLTPQPASLNPQPTTPSGWDRFAEKLSNLHFLIVPVPAYSPETNWSFGLAGAYYFTAKGQDKLSDIGFDAAYTLNHQWNINLNSTVYLGGSNRWFLWTRAGYKRYPDYFYGINAPFTTPRTPYTSDNIYLTLQPQYYLHKGWILGGNLDLYYDYSKGNSSLLTSLTTTPSSQLPGWNERILLLGVGGILSYDSRDAIYYPSRGLFMKLIASYYPSLLDMSRQFGKFSLDFRHYLPLYKDLIFAYQFKSECVLGSHVPFQMLPSIGGMDVLRGIRKGQFRDDAYLALQAELRFPIYKVLRGTAFWGVGDVYNLTDWTWQPPKMGYGVGLRLAINKQKVNIRFDIAHDYVHGKYAKNSAYNYWKDGFSFYLTVKEAL